MNVSICGHLHGQVEISKILFPRFNNYHGDSEKRGEWGVVAHERHESHVTQKGDASERHPFKSPRFSRSKWYIFFNFLKTAMGYCIKLDVKKVIAHHEAQEKQQQSGLAMIQVLIEEKIKYKKYYSRDYQNIQKVP